MTEIPAVFYTMSWIKSDHFILTDGFVKCYLIFAVFSTAAFYVTSGKI